MPEVAAIAVSLAALFVSIMALNYTKSALRFDVLSKTAEQAFSSSFTDAMMVTCRLNFQTIADYREHLRSSVTPEERQAIEDAVTKVTRFFDMLGVYVEHGIVDKKIVMGVLGSYIINAYHHTKFYTEASFAQEGSYPRHFKMLAKLAEDARYKPYAVWSQETFDQKIRRASAPGASGEDRLFL
jgi:hypothetical protein